MSWANRYDITKYVAIKSKVQMANDARKIAQRLIVLQTKRNEAPTVKPNRHGKHK